MKGQWEESLESWEWSNLEVEGGCLALGRRKREAILENMVGNSKNNLNKHVV